MATTDERIAPDLNVMAGRRPYPPRFDASVHPAGCVARVTARDGQVAWYVSTGVCWRQFEPR